MTPEKLTSKIILLDDAQAERLRRAYVDTFVDTAGKWYKENIEKLKTFSDGTCYTGYLWECLRQKPDVIGLNDVNKKLAERSIVYVFWDIHSKDKIQIPNYWKLPKKAVVQIEGKVLSENFDFFPEDIYIFDDTLSWSLIMTHEYFADSIEEHMYLYCESKNGATSAGQMPT